MCGSEKRTFFLMRHARSKSGLSRLTPAAGLLPRGFPLPEPQQRCGGGEVHVGDLNMLKVLLFVVLPRATHGEVAAAVGDQTFWSKFSHLIHLPQIVCSGMCCPFRMLLF